METPVSYEDIRKRFHVPARKGARVLVHGQPGTVTTVRGLTLRVRLDGMSWSRPYLPDELQWLPAPAPEPQGQGQSGPEH
ncbi:polysaccharide deacetylase [Variovorax boronicumulans]|uniref:polysaccharide deacetylase n=1 Tax=Variovorax boronicumulans TaxID=436515 RepID=UPI0012E4C456|nr:polysaccharide deacetylase [Variovorax boronicumulans]GER09838.1 polysaccharide deacetylase [Variovorax boronicumulans]